MNISERKENQPAYDVNCEAGICTAKLTIPVRLVYAVPNERGGALAKQRGLAALPAEITKRFGDGAYLGRGLDIKHREIDEAKRTILFVASDESEDRYGDIIRQDGWQLGNYRKNPVGLWCHDSNGMCSAHNGMPVARGLRADIAGQELLWLAQFWPVGEYEFSDLIFNAYRNGFMNAVSVGFIPQEFKFIEEGSGTEFLKQELLEVSFVPLPANPNALVADSFGKFAPAVRAIEVAPDPTEDSPNRQKPSEQLKAFCDEGRRTAQRFERKIDGIQERTHAIGVKLDEIKMQISREAGECPKGEDCQNKDGQGDCPAGEDCPMYGKGFEVRADKEIHTRRKFREWLKANGFSKKLLHADVNEDCHVARQEKAPETLPKAPEGILYFRDGEQVDSDSGKVCACKHAPLEIDAALELLRGLYEGAESDEQRIAIQRIINRTAEALTAAEPDIITLLAAQPEPSDLLAELAGATILRNPQSNESEGDSGLLQALSEAPAPPNVAA